MLRIQGKGISKGLAKGPLYFWKRTKDDIVKGENCDIQWEKQRLLKAQEKTISQLRYLAERCQEQHSEEAAILFETYAMLIRDEEYLNQIDMNLETERCTAEYAVTQSGEQVAAVFAGMNDAYMQARAADIRDVSRRLVKNLIGVAENSIDTDIPIILAADDLAPSETVQLDKSKILGIVTQGGSSNSHTAILARMMGIPAVCGLSENLKPEFDGLFAYVDGENGTIVFDPDEITQTIWKAKYEEQQERKNVLLHMKGKADVTLDGKRLDVYCNISSPDDIDAILKNDGRGIGLFRSEFLYLSASDFPSEEAQLQVYKHAAEAMNGKPVIIRTLDIGADKQAAYFHMQREENPALGARGIRICLNRPEIFKSQLRALYRASAYGKIAIMFPMITSVWEVKKCKRICQEVMEELSDEKILFNPDTQIGIMIETPAAVFIADELAKQVDFFSVGTNDLTQYILACDRQCDGLDEFFDPHHPALLRALKMTADAAHNNGIPIGICGELAADLSLLPTFLAMGIDELSVVPNEVLAVRSAIRKSFAGNGTWELMKD